MIEEIFEWNKKITLNDSFKIIDAFFIQQVFVEKDTPGLNVRLQWSARFIATLHAQAMSLFLCLPISYSLVKGWRY